MGILSQFLKNKPKNFLAIDFGRFAIKIAHLESENGNFKLLGYSLKPILPTLEKGEVTAVDFINNFLQESSFDGRDVILSISDSDVIFINYVVLPVLPEREILEAAKWQLKEDIPYKLESALLDWQVPREYIDREGIKRNGVIFVAAKREAIDRYLSIIYKCNLNPIRVTSSPFNYGPILVRHPQHEPVSAVLDIGYKDTSLCIYYNCKLNFIRKLTFSSEKLTQSLTGTLASERGKVELLPAQAEEIKNTFGLPQDAGQTIRENLKASQIISFMRPLLETLAREIKFSFDYFAANFNAERPQMFYLTGGGANLKNLNKYLSEELNTQISYLPLPGRVDTSVLNKEGLMRDQNQIISAIGAGLEGPRAINLLPIEIRTKKVEFVQKVSLRLVVIFLSILLLFLLFITQFQINDYKNRIKNASLHLQAVEKIKILKQRIDLRDGLICRIQKDQIPVQGILKLVSALIPPEIILNELIFDRPSHGLTLKGIVSAGKDNVETVLTNFIQRLESSLVIVEARLVFSKTAEEAQQFEIECKLIQEK